MAELADQRWLGDADSLGTALAGARSVRSVAEPHLGRWLPRLADCLAPPALFAPVDRRYDSFSAWWVRSSRGLNSAADLLAANQAPTW